MADSYPLTCVTGFWRVKNKHDDKYLKWFENTLKINCPYIVFSNKEGIEKDNPELFHKVCDGYGEIIPYLYGS